MRAITLLLILLIRVSLSAEELPGAPTLLQHVRAATVVILAGEGAGRLQRLGTGVVISPDGVILTAYHVVKGEAEVQVRLPNGDVFDSVRMIGLDERRDVAALKIGAGGLAFLSIGSASDLSAGDPVFAVTNANGLTWSATEGIFSAARAAEEVPGAGSGYRLLQFTAPVAAGSSGGALADKQGKLIGIITSAVGQAGLAVPSESVAGLQNGGLQAGFGSGSLLQLPRNVDTAGQQSSVALAKESPRQLLREAKTILLQSKTAFLTVDTLDHALRAQKDWEKLKLVLVQDPRVADVTIQIDRPLFTYIHTYVAVDKRTSIVLGSGKETAFDGNLASAGLAKQIVKLFLDAQAATTK